MFSAQRIRTAYLEILGYMSLDTRIADATQRPFYKDLLLDPDSRRRVLSHEQLGIDAQEFTPQERIQVRCARGLALLLAGQGGCPVCGRPVRAGVPGKGLIWRCSCRPSTSSTASARAELDSLVTVPATSTTPLGRRASAR